jgi:hypothetical protein
MEVPVKGCGNGEEKFRDCLAARSEDAGRTGNCANKRERYETGTLNPISQYVCAVCCMCGGGGRNVQPSSNREEEDLRMVSS